MGATYLMFVDSWDIIFCRGSLQLSGADVVSEE
jgi:hypothetical protein